jgi:integrase
MLSIRKRGNTWHVRGIVKQGQKKERVQEHTTGETEERAARAYADRLERSLKARLELGLSAPAVKALRPFDDALSDYIDNHKPSAGDLYRLDKLLTHYGATPLSDINAETWAKYCRAILPVRKPNTIARYQTTLRTLFKLSGDGLKFPDDIAYVKDDVELVRWLTIAQADKLIAAYPAHAKPIAIFMRYQGTRTQETLQLQRDQIDLTRTEFGSAYIAKSKNGRDRWIPLHPAARAAIDPLLAEQRPHVFTRDNRIIDPIFLSDKNRPYPDTRKGMGSNPMRRAHVAALKRAGVVDFRPHDWRHHWATWCVREGMDLRTLQELGGWLDLSMVQRYAAVDMDHASERLRKLK